MNALALWSRAAACIMNHRGILGEWQGYSIVKAFRDPENKASSPMTAARASSSPFSAAIWPNPQIIHACGYSR